ncbi:NEDD4-binding protein 2-like 1 isoform 4-T4 [Salvelinus alpinus]
MSGGRGQERRREASREGERPGEKERGQERRREASREGERPAEKERGQQRRREASREGERPAEKERGQERHSKILEEYGSGEAFSTDDYFRVNGKMVGFHKKYLQEAHEWNRNRVLQAIRGKVHPIVIDNTNMYKWEMWPYVRMAFRRGYWIEFEDLPVIPLEILNSWCPQIPMEVLERMNEGYEPVKKIWDVIYDYKSRGWWMPSPERLQNHW